MISHPFEIEGSAGAGEPDVLLIAFRGAPAQSVAEIYLPAVSAALVVAAAGRMYGRHRLTATDAHTIQFPAADIALIPVPGGAKSFAGLLSVEPHPPLPTGGSFTISVRQLHPASATIRPTPPPPPQRKAVSDAPHDDVPKTETIAWRALHGAFQYTIKATPPETLVVEQSRLVAWLKWRLGVLAANSRWKPVLERYLNYTETVVWTLGTDPNTIAPSPIGSLAGEGQGVEPCPVEPAHDVVGKVEAVLYDRFGDFCGFVILTEAGRERRFEAREPTVEHLVREAWAERTVVGVRTDAHHPERVDGLALLRAR
ncbi:MAG: hypothetical protein WCF69_01425 [Mycobacterium sp.]